MVCAQAGKVAAEARAGARVHKNGCKHEYFRGAASLAKLVVSGHAWTLTLACFLCTFLGFVRFFLDGVLGVDRCIW